eukprot:Hpha_TRINITY_DN15471_c5_g10::TRINITY_DN15471_c5_g10_i1::g.176754::m.176754
MRIVGLDGLCPYLLFFSNPSLASRRFQSSPLGLKTEGNELGGNIVSSRSTKTDTNEGGREKEKEKIGRRATVFRSPTLRTGASRRGRSGEPAQRDCERNKTRGGG